MTSHMANWAIAARGRLEASSANMPLQPSAIMKPSNVPARTLDNQSCRIGVDFVVISADTFE